MVRAYLVIVFVIGIAATLTSHVLSSYLSQPQPQQSVELIRAPAVSAASEDDQSVANIDGTVTLQRSANGHFYADVQVNGVPLHMLVDTGASGIALSQEDARAAGIAT